MMTDNDNYFDNLLSKEGGYVNNPDDAGGATHWGITEKTARAHGYAGNMWDLTREQAIQIYRADYWYGPNFAQVDMISPAIAQELLDTGVNMGPTVASKWLQRWLSALNKQSSLYPDLLSDGVIGPRTLSALKKYLSVRGKEGEQVLLRGINCSQGARYLELAEQREANETFLYGWLNTRVS